MTETLRPSTLGEILDRTAQLYRRNFWLFAGTAALPFVVLVALIVIAVPAGVFAGIAGIAGGGRGATDVTTVIRSVAFILAFLVAVPIYLAFYVFTIASITEATVRVHRGEKLTIRTALGSVRPRFWTYLWFLILQGVMAGIVPLILACVFIGPLIFVVMRPALGIAAGVALGFLIFVVAAAAIGVIIWLSLSYAMGLAVCVVEKKTAWESLTRSMSLSKGTRGRIFVLFLLIMVLSMIVSTVSYVFALLVAAVASIVGHGTTAAAVAAVVGGVLYFVVSISSQIVLQPVSWIALVLFYYDQRIRKEGFDIEWMMERAGMTQPPLAAPFGAISAPSVPPDTVEER
jgi:hypothetical protein